MTKCGLACLVVVLAGSLVGQTIQVNRENRTIAVTVTEKVTVLADVASVHVGFIAYGADHDAAYVNGSALSNAIHGTLTKAGVAEDSIESENQAVSPVQEYGNSGWTPLERQQRKFQVTQSWTVLSTAAEAAKVLDAAIKSGANQSGQISWSLRDENTPAAEAASRALQRARAVADQMARGLSAKLGLLIYASNETEGSPDRPLPVAFRALAMQQTAEPLAINPRQIEKAATVHAVFALD